MSVSRCGTRIEVELDADRPLAGHFDTRRGQSGRAHVLDGRDGARSHQFQRRFDQQLLWANGSPTCTVGRFSSESASNSADAMVAPWMPSRPVLDPK